MGKRKDITGLKFNRLLAVRPLDDRDLAGKLLWEFQCDCGNMHKANSSAVKCGNTKSCGCLRDDSTRERFSTHGMSGTKEYISWAHMLNRCFNENCKDYPTYGAVGIVAQESWRKFDNFIKYIGIQPKDGKKYSLDRIDNKFGYIEGNVRWATDRQQATNKTLNVTNKTGHSGIHWKLQTNWRKDTTTLYVVANWVDGNNNRKAKYFNADKYGKQEAMQMAIECRKQALIALDNIGSGYSPTHGQEKVQHGTT